MYVNFYSDLGRCLEIAVAQRQAFFFSAIVFIRHADDPRPLIAEGEWSGEIIPVNISPKGDQGFGYDPIFYLPTLGKTAAELSPTLKNTLSHRGQALQTLLTKLKR